MAADHRGGNHSNGGRNRGPSSGPGRNQGQANGGKPKSPPQQSRAGLPSGTKPPAKGDTGRGAKNAAPPRRIDLPIAPGTEMLTPEEPIETMTYIAYGEMGDDVAFELTEDLEEALEILEQMRDDGFRVKLYQAQEIDVVAD